MFLFASCFRIRFWGLNLSTLLHMNNQLVRYLYRTFQSSLSFFMLLYFLRAFRTSIYALSLFKSNHFNSFLYFFNGNWIVLCKEHACFHLVILSLTSYSFQHLTIWILEIGRKLFLLTWTSLMKNSKSTEYWLICCLRNLTQYLTICAILAYISIVLFLIRVTCILHLVLITLSLILKLL